MFVNAFFIVLPSSKVVFQKYYKIFWLTTNFLLKHQKLRLNYFKLLKIVGFNELICLFIRCLICIKNNKPLVKALTIKYIFWLKSLIHFFLYFIIILFMAKINFFLIAVAVKYFIGSFYYTEDEKAQFEQENKKKQNALKHELQ